MGASDNGSRNILGLLLLSPYGIALKNFNRSVRLRNKYLGRILARHKTLESTAVLLLHSILIAQGGNSTPHMTITLGSASVLVVLSHTINIMTHPMK